MTYLRHINNMIYYYEYNIQTDAKMLPMLDGFPASTYYIHTYTILYLGI